MKGNTPFTLINSGCEARSMRKFILVERPATLNSAKHDLNITNMRIKMGQKCTKRKKNRSVSGNKVFVNTMKWGVRNKYFLIHRLYVQCTHSRL